MPNRPKRPNTLEVCVGSLYDAQEAVAGGADRLELNCALELGGLTPTTGLLAEVRQSVSVPVIVMIRPRTAGFCYDAPELRTMFSDARYLLSQGADGLAFGPLSAHKQVNVAACRQLVQLAEGRETVFHRAIDVVADIHREIQQLIELGVTRVLTSGQARSAMDGADNIAQLQQTYGDRIEILPAAGITPDNVSRLLQRTRCTQVHGSFSRARSDDAGVVAESQYRYTDRRVVRAMRQILSNSVVVGQTPLPPGDGHAG